MRAFLDELRRRKVHRVAIAYLVGAWLVLQTSDATGLYARIGLSGELLSSMKQGSTLKVSFAAMNGNNFQIPLTLNGFTAVFAKLK